MLNISPLTQLYQGASNLLGVGNKTVKSNEPNNNSNVLPNSQAAQPGLLSTLQDKVYGTLAEAPSYLLSIPIIRNYTLRFIMPWVLRGSNVEPFKPELFTDKGYRVETIEPDKNSSVLKTKYLIYPKNESQGKIPMLIIHGARTSARSLGGCAQEALKANHPVIIGDLAGLGAKDSFSLKNIQNDIRGMLNFANEKFKGASLSILAHSFGTYNAMEALAGFMKDNPKAQVDKLLLVSPWDSLYKVASDLWRTDKSGSKQIETILHEVDSPYKKALNSVSESQLNLIQSFANTELAVAKLSRLLGANALSKRINEVGIIYGANDQHVYPSRSRSIANLMRDFGFNIRQLELPGAGHYDATSGNTTRSIRKIMQAFPANTKISNHFSYSLAA